MKNFILILFLCTNFVIGQTSEIKGVVTYYFNEYQGDKPDLGAKVFVLDSIKNPDFNYELMYNFDYGKSYRNYYSIFYSRYEEYDVLAKKYEGKKKHKEKFDEYRKYADENKVSADDVFLKMERFGVETEKKFSEMCSAVFDVFLNIETLKKLKAEKITIDANGSYRFELSPGTYYVLIKSKNRKGYNVAEIDGDVYFKKIKLKENESFDVSHNFELD